MSSEKNCNVKKVLFVKQKITNLYSGSNNLTYMKMKYAMEKFFVVLCIGEYFAIKIYFFPGGQKIAKVSSNFPLSGLESVQMCTFWEKIWTFMGISWQNLH